MGVFDTITSTNKNIEEDVVFQTKSFDRTWMNTKLKKMASYIKK